MESKIRHLEMIRAAISEAAGNSLRIKGFAMLLLAGSLALTLREGVGTIALPLPLAIILILITVVLGLLDFHYNKQSELFKILYNEVQARSESEIDFSMEVDQYSEQLDRPFEKIWPFPVAATFFLYAFIVVILLVGALPIT